MVDCIENESTLNQFVPGRAVYFNIDCFMAAQVMTEVSLDASDASTTPIHTAKSYESLD